MGWIFFREMTLTHSPEKDNFESLWVESYELHMVMVCIFFPKMTLTHSPRFGFVFQDLPIRVNKPFFMIYSNF